MPFKFEVWCDAGSRRRRRPATSSLLREDTGSGERMARCGSPVFEKATQHLNSMRGCIHADWMRHGGILLTIQLSHSISSASIEPPSHFTAGVPRFVRKRGSAVERSLDHNLIHQSFNGPKIQHGGHLCLSKSEKGCFEDNRKHARDRKYEKTLRFRQKVSLRISQDSP